MDMMKRQLYFFFFDVKRDKLGFFFGIVQITIAMLLVGYMLRLAGDSMETLSEFRHLQKQGGMYQVDCVAEAGQISDATNSETGQEAFRAFYGYLETQERTHRIIADASLGIFMDTSGAKGRELAEDEMGGLLTFSALRISSDFFDFADLELTVDRRQIAERFRDFRRGETVPVILGSDFQDFYEEGENFADSDGRKYRVVGFLKAGEAYAAPFESEKAIGLDRWMVVPRLVEPLSEGIGYLTDLVGTYFLTEDKVVMDRILEKAHELGLPPMEYRSLEAQLASDVNDLKNEAITMGCVMAVILLFATTGMISHMVRQVQRRLREFAIHALCGASGGELIFRVCAQLAATILSADAAALWVFKTPVLVGVTALFSVLYGVSVAAYPLYVFKKQEIVDVIRRNE